MKKVYRVFLIGLQVILVSLSADIALAEEAKSSLNCKEIMHHFSDRKNFPLANPSSSTFTGCRVLKKEASVMIF